MNTLRNWLQAFAVIAIFLTLQGLLDRADADHVHTVEFRR